jgi:hypothetical protein
MLTIYPRPMAWETAEPPASEQAEIAHGGGEQRGEDAREERLGPLAIARHRKDDGRALILYHRVGEARP